MFGTLRLLLAFMVAFSHLDTSTNQTINLGITAVVVFFIISGYVMTGLIRTHYAAREKLVAFYKDRMARIYPQFAFFLILTLFFLASTHFTTYYLVGVPPIKYIIETIFLIPLDLTMIAESIPWLAKFDGLGTYKLIHPAWSLGLEAQFYIIIPFVLFSNSVNKLIGASFVVFSLAMLEMIPTLTYGYFMLPGVLFIFLAGSLIYDDRHGDKIAGLVMLLVFASVLGLGALAYKIHKLALGNHNFSILVGFICGFPIVYGLSKLKRYKLDDWFGNISYGVFLSHVLVLNAAKQFHLFDAHAHQILFFGSSFLLGLIGYYLAEYPMLRYKKYLRESVRMATQKPAALLD